jgi:broad specificity phosphatase PhoE
VDATAAIPQPTLGHGDLASCEVLLIRHGRSADVVPGSPESADPPLHEVGVGQAAALARRLAHKPIDAVYSSHLARAFATATPLAVGRGLVVGVWEDLEEIKLGEWGNGEFRRRAAVADPEWLQWSQLGVWDGIPGGEGDAAFRRRVAAVVDRLAGDHIGETIAIVAHGGAIAAYLAHALGIARSHWMTVENTSVSVVRVSPGRHTVVTVNDCHHLYDVVTGVPASGVPSEHVS